MADNKIKKNIREKDEDLNKEVDSKKDLNDEVIYPVVAIGASAGGISAFEEFFKGIPKNNNLNMVYVLIQHLSPSHTSLLTEIISRYTEMPVYEVEDGITVKPNCVYVIPPNKNLSYLNGALQLYELNKNMGIQLPIDFFFRSLASSLHEKAICIVLSGTGSDGTLGLREIKGEGGIAIVQKPDTAEYDGMPLSAIATGLVDFILPPNEMGNILLEYIKYTSEFLQKKRADQSAKPENALNKIFVLLRNQTGHDFSKYKPSTINRRIERRLAVQKIDSVDEYLKLLQHSTKEVDLLFRDLLIGVTNFFRDKEAFIKIEKEIIPEIFKSKPIGSVIRVWCPACSTGEEAYSLAILLQEHIDLLKKNYTVQLFATDIDSEAISFARAGLYPAGISLDVSSERLSRFFTMDLNDGSYKINKTIRNMIIFSEQSIIKDPPFSKLDLISCRNLLIYLSSELQKKIMPLFHYALKPNGYLILGSSETIGSFDDLFVTIDRKYKIYQRREDVIDYKWPALTRIIPISTPHGLLTQNARPLNVSKGKQSLKEIMEQSVLEECQIVGALVNENGDILYLHGRTGMYLEPTPGETRVNNIIRMAREGLKLELVTALRKSVNRNEIVQLYGVQVNSINGFISVNLTVRPLSSEYELSNEKPMYLVIIEENKEPKIDIGKYNEDANEAFLDIQAHIEELERELRKKDESLQSAYEELETSNEELMSSIEEMQSVNEELQSANEELETSKEELQSINEELLTVNIELQDKVQDLTQVNNDIINVFEATNIATIFLDDLLKIKRFTPTANKIINLIPSDIGRPISQIVTNFAIYKNLKNDVIEVISSQKSKEIEVQTNNGKWYNMIIKPYEIAEGLIEGAVLIFVDISDIKMAKDKLIISELLYRSLFETTMEGVLVVDGENGNILNVNPYLMKLLGFSEEQLLEKSVWDVGLFTEIANDKESFLELQKNKNINYEKLSIKRDDGNEIDVELISNVLTVDKKSIIQYNIRDTFKK